LFTIICLNNGTIYGALLCIRVLDRLKCTT